MKMILGGITIHVFAICLLSSTGCFCKEIIIIIIMGARA